MARDFFHHTVKNALIKDGWTITHDPYPLQIKNGPELKVDLGAEQILSAERGSQKIAVEIKSFLGTSEANEFNSSLGQFFVYKQAIQEKEPDRTLYLAIPKKLEKGLLKIDFFKRIVNMLGVKMILFEPDKEEIVKWM